MRGFFVENFGCRATQADGAALERQFEDQGFVRAATSTDAAVVVLNTCTVTASADQDARAAIRRVKRQNPDAQIIVTGCYAQRAPDEVAALQGVRLVVGNSHKHQLAEIAVSLDQVSSDSGLRKPAQPSSGTPSSGTPSSGWRSASSAAKHAASQEGASAPEVHGFIPLANLSRPAESRIFVSDIFAHTELLAAPVFDAANERTRPNLKIQDGCDNRCSFCVIPYVRGQSRSLSANRIIGEVNALVDSGYREVVISGINLGRWGRDLQNARIGNQRATLESLIAAILDETRLEKLRISSVEPMDWSDELIELIAASPRIAKHAHVPMQSGSDAVLRRMHRKYRPWHYREKIEKIHAAMPQAAIGADVMVGFPGETDQEFEDTRRMVDELPFTYLHVFTYSARPGTPAAAMPHQVPVHIARERNRILRELASEKKLKFMRGFIGKSLAAITLNVSGTDECGEFTETLTDNYLKLRLQGSHEANTWMQALVRGVTHGMLTGEVAAEFFTSLSRSPVPSTAAR